jgi:two-component system NtrC family response regulator
MDQLNDLISNYPFKCQKCEAQLTSEWLVAAAATYGVALIAGEKDGWIGWSCPGPDCGELTANFTRLEKAAFNQVINEIREAAESAMLGRFCYHSFPYRHDLQKEDCAGRSCMEINGDFEALMEAHLFPEEVDFIPPADYCSYIFGTDATGPAIAVWWYDENQVKNLIKRENQTGLKRFPRYIVHNPLYATINAFCWHNRLHFEYLKQTDLPFDVKEIFLCTEKKRINKAVDFLHLLDTVNVAELRSMRLSEEHSLASIGPPLFASELVPPASPSSDGISVLEHEKLSERVWAAFHADWMQDLLENLAEDFISDYLGLIRKIDCNLQSIWNLKQSYLKTLFDAVSSRHKRERIQERTNANLRERVAEAEKAFPRIRIISDDPRVNEIKIRIAKVASHESASSFLILGEPGTGKDLFARAIHAASLQKGQFVKVDCGSIPEKLFETEVFGSARGAFTGATKDSPGKFGAAAGGTLFFDEIGNLPLSQQPKLLRALQDREYVPVGSNQVRRIDAKFVFATNRNLEKMVAEGTFMPDLYDRLKRPSFTVPPLRERKNDLPLLAAHFIKKYDAERKKNKDAKPISLSEEAEDALKKLDWPGNIRDLEQVISEIIVNRNVDNDRSDIAEADLPEDIFPKSKGSSASGQRNRKKLPGNTKVTDEEIIHWMKELGNNKTRVAERLDVSHKTIWERWRKISEPPLPAN